VHLGCEVSVNIVTVRFLLQADMYLEYMTHVSYHSVSTQPILERTRGQESAWSELQYSTKPRRLFGGFHFQVPKPGTTVQEHV
jgi:hypothetical protein